MRKGTIQLIDFEDTIVRNKRYQDGYERKRFIEKWKKEYANKLDGCYFHITHDDFDDEVKFDKKTGLNRNKNYKEKIK